MVITIRQPTLIWTGINIELLTTAKQIAAPKPDFEAPLQRIQRIQRIFENHHSQLSCSHRNTIYDSAAKDNSIPHVAPASTPTSTLPLPLPLLHLYSALFYTSLLYDALLILFSTLRCSTLRFSTLLFYTLLWSALFFSSLPLFYFTQVPLLYSTSTWLYATPPLRGSTSTLPLPLLYFTQVPSGHNDLWASGVWLHDLLRQVPTGHNDLCASENVTLWSLNTDANWTQWSLGLWECDFMIS